MKIELRALALTVSDETENQDVESVDNASLWVYDLRAMSTACRQISYGYYRPFWFYAYRRPVGEHPAWETR